MSGRGAGRAANLRLVALILEGYLYVLLVLGVFVAALGFLAWGFVARRPFIALAGLFIGVPIALTLAAAMRALAVPEAPSGGVEIAPEEAPALYAMVEDLRRRIRAPRVRRIVLGSSVNATAMQIPRFLLFFPRNELRLGYPLLVSLPPEHFRAVVAHELGHFSRAHGRFAVWVYRTRMAWIGLVETLHRRGTAPIFVYWLHRFYVPRLDALSFSVARDQEFVADRCAADIVGTRAAADALVAIDLLSRHHDEVWWPATQARLERDPDGPRPFGVMALELRGWRETAEARLQECLHSEAGAEDTHPTLAQRLGALGEPARIPDTAGSSAADAYLGPEASRFTTRLDDDWAARYGSAWRSRGDEVRRHRDRLAALGDLSAPSPAERLEQAQLVERLEGVEAALPLYRSAHDAGSPAAGLALGRLLLERGDAAGVALIEEAMGVDDALVPAGCELLIPFHLAHRRLHEAARCQTRAGRHAMRASLAEAERSTVGPLDQLAPHALGEGELAPIRTLLSASPGVTRAWLARRRFRHAEGEEFLLGVVTRSGREGEGLDPGEFRAVLPGATRLLRLESVHPEVRKRLEALPDARVFPYEPSAASTG